MGRIVDGYTNIPTLKLFAHGGREQAYVAESIQSWQSSTARRPG